MLVTDMISVNCSKNVINKILKRKRERMKNIKNLKVYNKCLIVVDMVNGFVKEGILHDKTIAKIIKEQEKLINEYLENKNLVIFIKDTHTEKSTEFKRFGNTYHCIKGSSESQLVDELKCYEKVNNTISINKNSTSFMEAPKFRKLIKKLKNLNEVEVIGCCTDICVTNGVIALSNYFDEWNKEVIIRVYEDLIETYGSLNHDRNIYTEASKLLMKQQGIQLIKRRKKDIYGK